VVVVRGCPRFFNNQISRLYSVAPFLYLIGSGDLTCSGYWLCCKRLKIPEVTLHVELLGFTMQGEGHGDFGLIKECVWVIYIPECALSTCLA